MKYAICNLSIVPVRGKPVDSAEMTSQLLFGELMEVQAIHKGWTKIRMVYDDYEGWIDAKQMFFISDETFSKFNQFPPHLIVDLIGILRNVSNDMLFPVVFGSSLPYIVNNTFYIEDTKYEYEGNITDSNIKPGIEAFINNAYMYLNTPYLWGGRSPFGIDCSGLIQMSLKMTGIKMPRDAWQQAEIGSTIDFLPEAGSGDILFFENEEGKIIHTGILLEKDKILHASGYVRIDRVDHEGIFNVALNKYTHKLRLIKRVIN